jgi:hypothetical protein
VTEKKKKKKKERGECDDNGADKWEKNKIRGLTCTSRYHNYLTDLPRMRTYLHSC